MSTRPHILWFWTIRRTRLPQITFRGIDCYSDLASTGDGTSVNANGTLVDIRVPTAYAFGNHTSRITGHHRVPVRYLDPILLHRHCGDSARRGPEPGRAARWPWPGQHHAAVRARSLITGHDRRSGPARYRRRR
jgi:hypothetical protein